MLYYNFNQKETILLPRRADSPAITEILRNYTPGIEWSFVYTNDDCHIHIGAVASMEVQRGKEYAISVKTDGIAIGGQDYKGTIRGLLTLLELVFCYGKHDYRVECTERADQPRTAMRSLHVCFFPDFTVDQMRRVIRAAAVAKYSHIVLEFWGNLHFDCMKELSWPNANTKQRIRSLVREANALGMEVIPFYQHLGHAAMARLSYSAKHVVLDQNLEYEYLYYPKSRGWVWNFRSEETKQLLRCVRRELIELCGEGEYFHLGCDEAGLEFDIDELSAYLNEVADELLTQGRRPIVWGDMLLSHDFETLKTEGDQKSAYICNASAQFADALLDRLDKRIIIADWQYDTHDPIWKTSLLLKGRGFDVICAPWDDMINVPNAIATVESAQLHGVMVTTWNRLFLQGSMVRVLFSGLCASGDPDYAQLFGTVSERTTNIWRRVSPRGLSYEDCGWSRDQV